MLTEVRALELRILTLRGQAAQMADSLDWLESASRETGSAEDVLIGLGSSAFARAGLRTGGPGGGAAHGGRGDPRCSRGPELRRVSPGHGPHRPGGRRAGARRAARRTASSLVTRTPSTRSSPRTPHWPRTMATSRRRRTPMPRRRIDGRGSASCPSGVRAPRAGTLSARPRPSGRGRDGLRDAREIFEWLDAAPMRSRDGRAPRRGDTTLLLSTLCRLARTGHRLGSARVATRRWTGWSTKPRSMADRHRRHDDVQLGGAGPGPADRERVREDGECEHGDE